MYTFYIFTYMHTYMHTCMHAYIPNVMNTHRCVDAVVKDWTITDLAGIFFRRSPGVNGDRLVLLTEEGKALFAMDMGGRFVCMYETCMYVCT